MEGRNKSRSPSRQPKEKPFLEAPLHWEIERLKIETKKIALEREEIEINVLVEDFKARWQELVSLNNENNRWTTLYVTALLLVIGWVINNSGQNGGGLADLYARSDNAYLILSIAVLNALYAFSMAFKGYQIQQIALYQYEVIGRRIRDLSKDFNQWERYRRINFMIWRGYDPIRLAYSLLVKSLPFVVSYTIILLYWRYQWSTQAGLDHLKSSRNWFSFSAFFVVNCAVLFSLRTLKLGKRWTQILDVETSGECRKGDGH